MPSSSRSPTLNSVRRAVETDAISPNSAGCPASTARSETQRPPSAAMTARSHNTRPGSCAERRSRVPVITRPSSSQSPRRCAVNASSAVPAREDNPVASARTSTVPNDKRPITFKVTS